MCVCVCVYIYIYIYIYFLQFKRTHNQNCQHENAIEVLRFSSENIVLSRLIFFFGWANYSLFLLEKKRTAIVFV